MAESSRHHLSRPYTLSSSAEDNGAERPRKKVRKGTKSCWECKRRKVRCTFSAPEDGVVCDGCNRRRTPCVGQEFPDEPATTTTTTTTTMSPVLEKAFGYDVGLNPIPTSLSEKWPSSHDLDLILSAPLAMPGLFCKAAHMMHSASSTLQDENAPSSSSPRHVLNLPPQGSHPVLFVRKLLLLGIYIQGIHPASLTFRHRSIRDEAVSAATLILKDDNMAGSIEGIECILLESLYEDNAGNLRRSWMAIRRAIALAQVMGLHRTGKASLLKVLEPDARPRIDQETVWFRLVQADHYLSLMLGLPQASADNFFAAPKALEGNNISPIEKMRRLDCFAAGRILQRNCIDDDSRDLDTTREIDRLLQKASASMPPRWWSLAPIHASNPTEKDDRGDMEHFQQTTQIMDQLAHHNLVVQLHLPYLLRSPSSSSVRREYDYSKLTAVSSSREVLTRFVAFRSAYPLGSYCRGVNFLAFIASTALCLALLEAHRRRVGGSSSNNNDDDATSVFGILAHQRPSDRGLMERALECMEHMASAGNDVVASKMATILGQLLVIEADAASGAASCHADSSLETRSRDDGGQEELGELRDGGNVLYIHVPYLGTVKIERSGVSTPTTRDSTFHSGQALASGYSQLQAESANPNNLYAIQATNHNYNHNTGAVHVPCGAITTVDPLGDGLAPNPTVQAHEWALQGVDMAFFDSLMSGPDRGGEPWIPGGL